MRRSRRLKTPWQKNSNVVRAKLVARFIDTSVLVRYFTQDDLRRADVAEAIIEADDLVVSGVILSETAYVLHRTYGYSRSDVAGALVQFILRENVEMVDLPKELAAVALRKSQASARLSFGDALILAQMQASGHREIYSFDTRFRDDDITVLDAPTGVGGST